MINYTQTNVGDILRIVGQGAPGYAQIEDLVRVISVDKEGVKVENKKGETCEFIFNCGAARLEPTEWKKDFNLSEIEIDQDTIDELETEALTKHVN